MVTSGVIQQWMYPNVVGKQVSVAKNILEDKHLRVSTSEVTNPDVPAGQVISQTPGAGGKG